MVGEGNRQQSIPISIAFVTSQVAQWKEPACDAGDPNSIPGLGRSTGEGMGYPLQYSAGEVGLIPGSGRREMLPTPVFWPEEFHGLYSPQGGKELDTTEWLSLSFSVTLFMGLLESQSLGFSYSCFFSLPAKFLIFDLSCHTSSSWSHFLDIEVESFWNYPKYETWRSSLPFPFYSSFWYSLFPYPYLWYFSLTHTYKDISISYWMTQLG